MERTRGIRNKNPFNIKYSANCWKGKINPPYKKDDVFEEFRTFEYGIRAGICLIQTYVLNYGLNTVRKVVSRFAPSGENDTDTYIRYVCSHDDGLRPDDEFVVGSLAFFNLLHWICFYESKYNLTYDTYLHVCTRFRLL